MGMASDTEIKVAELDVKVKYIEKQLDKEVEDRKDGDSELAKAQEVQGEGLKKVTNKVLVLTTGISIIWTLVNFAPRVMAFFGG